MISSISSLQNFGSDYSYRSASATPNPPPSETSQPAPVTSPIVQDSIQLSAAGLAALQTPEEIFTAAAAGDARAIAIIEKNQHPA